MLYEGISFAEYCTLPGVNYSRLKLIKRSFAHFKQWEAVQHESTDAQTVGKIYDAVVTSPETIDSEYFIGEVPRKNSKAYRDFLSQAEGKTIIDIEDYNIALAMRDVLQKHSLASGLLQDAKSQISVTWDRCGVMCKGRIDLYSPELGALIELKSTRDARLRSFRYDAEKFGYFGQLEFYGSGLKANSVPVTSYYIICQETEAPYGVQVYKVPLKAIESCSAESDGCLLSYKNAVDTEKFTCYDESLIELDRPAYAYREE